MCIDVDIGLWFQIGFCLAAGAVAVWTFLLLADSM